MGAFNFELSDEFKSQVLEISLSKNTVSDFYKTILEGIPANGEEGYILFKSFEFDVGDQEVLPFIEKTQFQTILLLNGNLDLSGNDKIKQINSSKLSSLKNLSFLFISSPQLNYAVLSSITEESVNILNPTTKTTITESPLVMNMFWEEISKLIGIPKSEISIHNPEHTVLASERVVFDVISKLDSSRVVSDQRVFELSSLLKFLNNISGRFVEEEFLHEVGKKLIELTEAPVGFIQSEDLETEEVNTVLFWEGFELFIGEQLSELDFPTRNYLDTLVEQDHILFNLDDKASPFLEPDNLSKLHVTNGILYPLYGPEKVRGSLILLFPETKIIANLNRRYFDEIAAAVSIGFKQLISHKKIHKEAITDGMTELYNHRFFMNQLSKEMERSRRYQNPLTLLMIDIDHFKHYNDTNGHVAGDTILKSVASIFRNTVRRSDFVTRYGGEEFAILLPETPLQNAKLVAEKIRNSIEKEEFENQKNQPNGNLTISIGVSEQTKDLLTPDDFVHSADLALYQAKETGRNKVCLTGED